MGRQFLDIEDLQPASGEDTFDGRERQVGIVLVIDRVELDAFDQPQEVRKLEGSDAVRLQRIAKPLTKSAISGTCASTLLAAVRSARTPRATSALAVSRPKKAT